MLPSTPRQVSPSRISQNGATSPTTGSSENVLNHHPSNQKQRPGATHEHERKRKRTMAMIILVPIILILVVVLPVYFVIIRPKQLYASGNPGSGSSDDPGAGSGSNDPGGAMVTGGDGSKVKMEDGTEFTYRNSFGGYWYFDPNHPFDNSARAQSWTPPLNQSWKFGEDKIYGVNLGGWLVLEPFIVPRLFEQYSNLADFPVDEYTLSFAMANDSASGGLKQLEEHYRTFITEEDFAAIASAGLNWVRIPLPFWAIEKYPDEPYLEKVAWKYFLKAIKWARKYGIRINLDLHTISGSQNPWNHSGRQGSINFLNGVMGLANAQRTLNHIRTIAEFISQPQYRDVVPFFGIINEPRTAEVGSGIPMAALKSFYLEAYKVVRNAGGVGEGNGPWVGLHDGFAALSEYYGFLDGADRIAMDTHPYFAFTAPTADPLSVYIPKPCNWNGDLTISMNQFGFTSVGEWSLAINDCGKYVNGIAQVLSTNYEKVFGVGRCVEWTDWTVWDVPRKEDLKQFMLSNMDATQNFFFWTWKVGNSSVTGKVEAPLWSYRLGWEQGWIPTDPRASIGQCNRVGNPIKAFAGPLKPWQTGGVGAGNILPAQLAQWGQFPPAAIGGQANAAALPRYTATGPIATLPVQTELGMEHDLGTGWYNNLDNALDYVPIVGCSYPDHYRAENVPVPPPCPGPR